MLPEEVSNGMVSIRLDVGLSPGETNGIIPWLNNHLLTAVEDAVFNGTSRSWEDFVGVAFFDEYKRWSEGTMRPLYETDKNQFKITGIP